MESYTLTEGPVLDSTLQELETWRRDLRNKEADLLIDQAYDAPLRMLNVTRAVSCLEMAIYAVQGAQNAMQECADIIEQLDGEQEVSA